MASRKSKKVPDVLSAAYLERASGKVSISIIISFVHQKNEKNDNACTNVHLDLIHMVMVLKSDYEDPTGHFCNSYLL